MRITGFNIERCKRFPLLGTPAIANEFGSDLIMVEGSNGAGKSSLFSMLSPLPADRTDFEEGGIEEIFFKHRGHDYTVTSNFENKTPRFSFMKDNEELNLPGLITTQRELSYSEFGITASIHALITGAEVFTDLSFGARKKLFSTLTRLNIDKVLKSYSKLIELLNLKKLQLKTEQQQYNFEESKLSSEEEIREVKSEMVALSDTIDKILALREGLLKFESNHTEEDSYQRTAYLKEQYVSFVSENTSVLSLPNISPESLDKEIREIENNIVEIDAKLPLIYSQYEKLLEDQKKHELTRVNDQDHYGDMRALKLENETLKEFLMDYFDMDDLGDVEGIKRAFYRIHERLPPLASECEGNYDEETSSFFYNASGEVKSRELLEVLSKEHNEISCMITDIRSKEKTLQEFSQDVTCDGCGKTHTLKNLIDLKSGTDGLEYLNSRRESLEKEIKDLNDYIDGCVVFRTYYNDIQSLRRDTETILPHFWRKASEGELTTKYFSGLNTLIVTFSVAVANLTKYLENNVTIRDLEKLIRVIEETSGYNVESVAKQISLYEKEISSLRNSKVTAQARLESKLVRKDVYNASSEMKELVKLSLNNVRSFNLSQRVSSIISTLDERVRMLRLTAVEMDNAIREGDNIKYLLKKKGEVISELEDDIFLLEISQNELSPKSGLIASTISSFLNTIIENINLTLERIWSYKMVLVPIDVEKDALNYKFKVEVEDKLTTEDISKVSRGMKEAINLSFKLVLYRLLGFENYPLFLDELASNMDVRHTEMMSDLIHAFSQEKTFSQIFIISHKESMDFLRDIEKISLS